MELKHAECCCLLKDTQPGCRIELVGAAVKLDWIGAIGAREWAAVCELGQKP
jgi:hypothetical protein